ncbi:NAD-dependent epimerase/dehydratase family protein [Gammaproteobacteria bacterium]|nr:NAD-dependent epimerase/dehydratase family protein [Gammaproteobacteria bacterium]
MEEVVFVSFKPLGLRPAKDFSGHCGQYVFISSASTYQKPWNGEVITEDTALENPFWEYSRMKADCEVLLFEAHAAGQLPVTVVRPSHTYRRRLPGTCFPGDHMAWRILNNKPIIVHDDGESLWTLTHANDFARALASLCGNKIAIGEAFHITSDSVHTWNEIIELVSKALDHPIKSIHVPVEKLIEYSEMWRGPLKGDKANSIKFDNNKVREAIGGWQCEIELPTGLIEAAAFTRDLISKGYTPDKRLDALIDRVISDQ